jgi:quinol monooxygenase YgiN
MYAQVTYLQISPERMNALRDLLESHYLPVVRQRPGFKAGYLLEQVDDPGKAQLIFFWDEHASVEAFNRTGMLQATLHSLTAEMPDLSVHRLGYTVPLGVRALEAAAVG